MKTVVLSLKEMKELVDLVDDFFNGDQSKSNAWMREDNILLGGKAPIDMVLNGRSTQLREFIEAALAENQRNLQ